MSWAAFGETFVTLFVITDPVGNAPSSSRSRTASTPRERQRAAIRAVIAAGALILGFAIFGELVLRYLDVSIESLSIAGGLLLLLVALEMLRGTDFPTGDSEDVALVPLATPLVAGPGAIATAIVLWREHPHAGGHAAVILAILAAVTCVGLALLVAERLDALARTRRSSRSSTRVFGLLLSAIAVQLVVNGVLSSPMPPQPSRASAFDSDCRVVSIPACRSPSRATRSSTAAIVNAAGSRSGTTSSHVERRRHRRARPRAHRVDRRDRLALAVLVRVDQHAAAPRLRPLPSSRASGCARTIAAATSSANARESS